jgi:DNA-directed RNA polymerase III subunit RPC11
MLFCPTCANLLLIEKTVSDFRFFCKTCPYIFLIEQPFEKAMYLEKKEVDDILGGKDAWKDVDKTDANC